MLQDKDNTSMSPYFKSINGKEQHLAYRLVPILLLIDNCLKEVPDTNLTSLVDLIEALKLAYQEEDKDLQALFNKEYQEGYNEGYMHGIFKR